MSDLAKGREWVTFEEILESFYGKMPNPEGSAAAADFLMRCVQGEFCLSMYLEVRASFRPGSIANLYQRVAGTKYRQSEFVPLSDELVDLDGVLDLPMLGTERIIVMNTIREYLGQDEQRIGIDCFGVLVKLDSKLFQLVKLYERDPDLPGSKAQLEKADLSFISLLFGKRKRFKQRREQYLRLVKAESYQWDWIVPSQKVPESSQLVIRAEHLEKVESWFASNTPQESKLEQTFSTKERNTLLVLIAALAKEAKIDLDARGIAGAIQLLTEQIGAPVSDDTIRNVLKQIREAVESRQK